MDLFYRGCFESDDAAQWTSQNIGSGNHEFFIAPYYFKFTIFGTLPLNLACKLLQKRYRLGYEIIYPKPWIAAIYVGPFEIRRRPRYETIISAVK